MTARELIAALEALPEEQKDLPMIREHEFCDGGFNDLLSVDGLTAEVILAANYEASQSELGAILERKTGPALLIELR